MTIERPTPLIVAEKAHQFDVQDEDYDAAVRLVFERWPLNTVRAEILVKVVVLNRLYSTNIYDVAAVASRIRELDFDGRVKEADKSLVNELAEIRFRDRTRRCPSFASKYCAWHNPDAFPIYDGFVEDRLWAHQTAEPFCDFKRDRLSDYTKFCEALERFRNRFGLTACSLREIDKFLWIEGEEESARKKDAAGRAQQIK